MKKRFSFFSSVKSIAPSVLSVILLVWTIGNSGLSLEYLQLDGEQWVYFLLAVAVLVLTVWVQSIRVKIPWESWTKDTSRIDALSGLFIGNFYNCILPGNLGEGVRAWHFRRKNNFPFSAALASIGVEKYIDALNFIFYGILLCFLFHSDRHILVSTILVCGAISAVFVFYLIIITQRPVERWVMGLLLWFLRAGRWLYRVHYHIKGFLLRMTWQQVARYLLWGYLMFALNTLQYYLIMRATHIPDAMIGFKSAFLVAIAMVLVCILPSAPGNIGVLHFGIYTVLLSTLREYHIAADSAVLRSLGLYTVYLHFSYFLPEVVVGGLVVLKERKWIF